MVAALGASLALGNWHAVPPLRRPRAAHAVVATRTAIYVLGGTGPGGAPTGVDRFDGRRWGTVSQLPHGCLNAPAAVAISGRIFLIGGFEEQTNLPTDRVDVYDPPSHNWVAVAPLPSPRGGEAAAVLEGKIHVLGGGNSESTLADHSVYDPATDTWTDAAPLPRSEGSPAAVVYRAALYAIGGRSGFSDFADVYRYDAQHDRWTKAPSLPSPRGTGGAVVFRGELWYLGGESQARRTVLGDVVRLNGKTWRRVTTLPHPRNDARTVVWRDAIWVVGGSTSFGNSHGSAGSTLVERFAPR